MLTKHKQQCGKQYLTSSRISNESHLYWKKSFQKDPIYFRLYANSEADNEIHNSSIGNETTKNYKQNPVLDG